MGLKKFRKELKLDNKELDAFIDNKSVSTKYYLEQNYQNNKFFKYLLFLRKKGVDINAFFDSELEIKN